MSHQIVLPPTGVASLFLALFISVTTRIEHPNLIEFHLGQ